MSLPAHLHGLNPNQLEAVTHADGPLLIFAGAGSGKTRVLTRRIAHLVLEHAASPGQILAVTFTNKAAKEMKHRVDSLFPGRTFPVWVGTFHSTCVRILRQHAKYLDFTSQFAIYDSSDSLSALKRVYKKLNFDPKFIDPRSVSSRIDKAKNDYRFAESILNDAYTPQIHREMIAEIFNAYQAELKSSNAMDFGDLLSNTVTLFKLEPELLAQYQQRFKYLLIDEYQDTNRVQYLLVKMLSEKFQNLCVVGDDDQSIYAFRGATIENILNFKKDFPDAKIVTLDQNYRSTKNILSAANSVIVKNTKRQAKKMRTENPSGNQIICFRADEEKDEADFVTSEISALLAKGTKASEIVIFYRTNAQSRAIEEAFCAQGLPYEIYGGQRFYDRKEIKDILAYYRLLLNPNDNEAFLRIINTPARGIGSAALGELTQLANNLGTSLLSTLQTALESKSPQFSSAAKAKLSKFADLIKTLKEESNSAENLLASESESSSSKIHTVSIITGLLKSIAEKSLYLKHLREQDTLESEARIENIHELFRVALEFSNRSLEQGGRLTLSDFLDRACLASDLDKDEAKTTADSASDTTSQTTKQKIAGSISLMTLHLAKGLEFDVVFFVGLEEGIIPHVRSLESKAALEEERRLCYVGITRARKQLYLSRVTDRQSFSRGNYLSGQPSRFIYDLPENVLDDRRSGFVEFRRRLRAG